MRQQYFQLFIYPARLVVYTAFVFGSCNVRTIMTTD